VKKSWKCGKVKVYGQCERNWKSSRLELWRSVTVKDWKGGSVVVRKY